MATPVKDGSWLAWIARLMGAASRQRHSAMLPPEQFHCLLDELPLHLIPQHGLDRRLQLVDTSQPLFLNPECLVLPAGVAPPELEPHRQLLEGLHLQSTVAWVREPATGSLHPFWLGPQLEALVSNLRTGEPVPASFPKTPRVLLTAAGILTPEDYAHRRRAEWSTIVSKRRQTFRERNYVPLGDLIHPFNLGALRRYYRYAIRRGAIWLGDEQSALRYVAHNEAVARYFHHQIAKAVADIVGEPIKPSYVYLASYMSGAELKKHTDREQCEFSVTLCLDFSPEPALATPWPIQLDTSAGTVTAYQALGDGLVYRGTRVPHCRDVLAHGYTSTSLFFHYVPAGFSGPLN
ncbi:MAG TPA: hypothetical protein VFF50_07640 [Candidatus Deferrimicrobiaceae bacterium]|nr:hypothetical protein [Candidatus Deferrimicrobiaceae bacterium]